MLQSRMWFLAQMSIAEVWKQMKHMLQYIPQTQVQLATHSGPSDFPAERYSHLLAGVKTPVHAALWDNSSYRTLYSTLLNFCESCWSSFSHLPKSVFRVLFLLTKSLHPVQCHAQTWWWCIQSYHSYSLEKYWIILSLKQTQSGVGASSILSTLLVLNSKGHFAPLLVCLCSPFLHQIVRRDIVGGCAKVIY